MNGCKVGAARTEITPDDSRGMAGYSALGKKAIGPSQSLFATAIALEDAAGERLVMVWLDLHSAPLHLCRLVAARVCAATGLSHDRLVLAGTHTHSGPGQFFGNTLYDKFTGPESGILLDRSERLAATIADLAIEAMGGLASGGAAIVRPKVWQASSNRCMPAFKHNPEGVDDAAAWFVEGAPGHGAPQDLCAEDRCVDPRVTGLVVWDEDGKLLAMQGLFAVHGTSLGSTVDHYNPDWGGPAARRAQEVLDDAGQYALVGWACGAAGDMSPMPQPPNRADPGVRPSVQGQDLANAVGERLGEALAAAALQGTPQEFTLGGVHTIWRPAEDALPGARFGLATLGGAIDGQHKVLYPVVGGGVRSGFYGKKHGQFPKTPAMPGFLMERWAPGELLLHVVRIGSHVFATMPGEPTVATAWRLEQALCDLPGVLSASVVGYAGEYAGYWVTPEEYDEQLYQGASTLFGRQSTPALIRRIVQLAQGVAESA